MLMSQRSLTVRLVGASLVWFLINFAYYGNTVSSPLVLNAITPHGLLLTHVLLQLAVFINAAAPGYVMAAFMMDRMVRKSIQILGFAMMVATLAAIALIPGIEQLVIPFIIIYGISYFFTEFGSNATTFVYPAEIFLLPYAPPVTELRPRWEGSRLGWRFSLSHADAMERVFRSRISDGDC
jgi:MFS transporter, PHS family, inorganic phosphate transporter